jgi:hypothetical protein
VADRAPALVTPTQAVKRCSQLTTRQLRAIDGKKLLFLALNSKSLLVHRLSVAEGTAAVAVRCPGYVLLTRSGRRQSKGGCSLGGVLGHWN